MKTNGKRCLGMATILAISMIFPNTVMAKASEKWELSENEIKFDETFLENVETINSAIPDYTMANRSYTGGTHNISLDISAYTNDNTDPNYAYILTDNTRGEGTITAKGETRWFACILDEMSKISVHVEMSDTMDADLYLFSLDSGTGTLNLIGSSTYTEPGTSEYYSTVLDSGTYFAAINSYEGTGNYKISYYQTNVDIDYEVNDSVSTATNIIFGSKIVGVLDCPYDVDIYKFTVSENTWVKITGNFPSSYDFKLRYASQGASAKLFGNSGNTYVFSPGTYWFVVNTKDGGYSSTVSYNITFQKLHEAGEAAENISTTGYGAKTGIEFWQSKDGKINYVNGHKIDIFYALNWDGSNRYGEQIYRISILPDSTTYCSDVEIVYFSESTQPIDKYFSREPALLMTFQSSNDIFYKIDCRCTGEYAYDTQVHNYNWVTVLINPYSGKIIDIYTPNFYYDFDHTNPNHIRIVRNYDKIEWNRNIEY